MNLFYKQFIHQKWFSTGLVLILMLGSSLSCIGLSAWGNARKQYIDLQNSYTTTAIPVEGAVSVSESWSADKDIYAPELGVLDGLDTSQIPGLMQIDRRCILSAHVPGCTTLTSGTFDVLKYNNAFDRYRANYSVLAVECVELQDQSQVYREEIDPETGTLIVEKGIISYQGKFRILEPIVRSAAYDLPPYDDTITIDVLPNAQGEIEVEVGKTYLVRGFYEDYSIQQVAVVTEQGVSFQWQRTDKAQGNLRSGRVLRLAVPPLYDIRDIMASEDYATVTPSALPNCVITKAYNDQKQSYLYVPDGSQPFHTEYQGDWRDFLETPAGAVWKEEIIPTAQLNQEAATVMLTDNVESLYQFNIGESTILSGRHITDNEYVSGKLVCLVSAAYARLNGLQVGDTLTLDFYNAGYAKENGSNGNAFNAELFHTLSSFPLLPENRMDLTQDYEIVGIYTGPEFALGGHNFYADTIFVPKQSVPHAESFEDSTLPLLTSLVLENGAEEKFEDYMKRQGMEDAFVCFDQGYAEAAVAMEALIENAFRLVYLSGILFVLGAGLSLYLHTRRMAPVVRTARLLGQSGKAVEQKMCNLLLGVALTAVALGCALGVVLFDDIVQQLLSDTLVLDGRAIVVAALAQMAFLSIASIAICRRITSKNLMQSGKEKGR